MSADDRTLISACLQGDPNAFGELVLRYQDRLFNSVVRLLDNPEDGRDVVQDAFLQAYQSLGLFKGESLFFTWLYRIAINSAITLKRKQKAVMRISLEGVEANVADAAESNRPGFALELAEDEQRVHQALRKLSPEHRAVLVMKELEGMKYQQIADVLQVPVGTVRSRLSRARLDLRGYLVDETTE